MAAHGYDDIDYDGNNTIPQDVDQDTNILRIEDDAQTSPPATQESEGSFRQTEEAEDRGLECEDGVLDEQNIGFGLKNLGRSADGTQLVYLDLSLPGLSLTNIDILADYTHIQKVELPYNELTDITCLGSMPYLIDLDVSHNNLDKLLDFNPPYNLRFANFAYNNITSMVDLSEHPCLTTLILDNNHIFEIVGLELCKRLTHLSLGHNDIDKIQGLDDLPIKYLNMSSNHLRDIENIETLSHLQELDLSWNKIRSLDGVQGHEYLEIINLETNEVIDMAEIMYLQSLTMLRSLNLRSNPIQELPDYRLSVLYQVQRLNELDRKHVEVREKVAATNLFSPPIEVISARDHIMHVVYSFLQPNRVLDSTLPSSETPYPMLVLVGPQGAGKKELALKLVEEFPDYFGYGISHTTRPPYGEEIPDKDYHYVTVDEFEEAVKMGKFLQTYSYHGHLYGLSTEAIESVAREGLACVVHLELEGVLTLKNTYFEPRYVLILSMNTDAQERRLKMKDIYTEAQITWMLDRTETYAEYNREHPGFFDMMINSDDIVEAYRRLRRLVMDYLGISAPTPTTSDINEASQGAESALDKENTDLGMTMNSAGMGARTWSKPSIPDSANQQGNLHKTLSPMPASAQGWRGVIEEESIKRRQSAAKEAMSGLRPPLYQQLMGKTPRTVPQLVSEQQGLGDEPGHRSRSAPIAQEMDALPPGSPDSSEGNDGQSSNLSNISEAHMDDEDEIVTLSGSPKAANTGQVDPLELDSSDESKSASGGPAAPRGNRPGSGLMEELRSSDGSRPGSSGGRLGSHKRQVLPPIYNQSPIPNALPEY